MHKAVRCERQGQVPMTGLLLVMLSLTKALPECAAIFCVAAVSLGLMLTLPQQSFQYISLLQLPCYTYREQFVPCTAEFHSL